MDDIRLFHECRHDGERVAAEVEVESGDHDVPRLPKLAYDVREPTSEELGLVDPDDVVALYELEKLAVVA